jgi:uncharacterized protein
MKRLIKSLVCVLIGLFLFLPVQAEGEYVTDTTGTLSTDEISTLTDTASSLSSKYNVNVYIRMVATTDGADIKDYAENIYNNESLGTENSGSCVMLVVAVDDRKYDILAHGDTANAAFTDYGKDVMGDDIVSYLKDDNWYGGVSVFLQDAETDLQAEADGAPVDTWIPEGSEDEGLSAETITTIKICCVIGIPLLIALIVCLVLRSRNKTANEETEAHSYVPQDGIHLTKQQDSFMYRQVIRTPIPHDNDDGGHFGGTSVNSGGFSHSSGSF